MSTSAIQQYLPKHLRQTAEQFVITDDVFQKFPKIVQLVLESKSLDKDDEKQSWFNLLPLMNQEQIAKLDDILTREKVKLAEIEQKYSQKKQEISQKLVKKFAEENYHKKMHAIKNNEAEQRNNENKQADDLLSQI